MTMFLAFGRVGVAVSGGKPSGGKCIILVCLADKAHTFDSIT